MKSSHCLKDTKPEISPLWNKSLKPLEAEQQTLPLRLKRSSLQLEMKKKHLYTPGGQRGKQPDGIYTGF